MGDLSRIVVDDTLIEPTIEDLKAQLETAKGWAERGRIARLITASREREAEAANQELRDECSFRECALREEHGLSAAQVTGICDYSSLVATGHGVIVVRELAVDDRRAAVNAVGRIDSSETAGLFLTDPALVTAALLKCALHPNPKTPEGTLAIQQMVRDAFPLAHAGYKRACVMAGILAASVTAKSEG